MYCAVMRNVIRHSSSTTVSICTVRASAIDILHKILAERTRKSQNVVNSANLVAAKMCSRLRLVKQVFCSADCYYEYWENQKVAADQRVCLFCEEIFESSHHAKVYCSHGCYKKAQKLRRQNLR